MNQELVTNYVGAQKSAYAPIYGLNLFKKGFILRVLVSSEWDWSYRENNEQVNIIKCVHTSSKNYIYNGWVLALALLEFLFWVIFYYTYWKMTF